jgi:hypothetical protein
MRRFGPTRTRTDGKAHGRGGTRPETPTTGNSVPWPTKFALRRPADRQEALSKACSGDCRSSRARKIPRKVAPPHVIAVSFPEAVGVESVTQGTLTRKGVHGIRGDQSHRQCTKLRCEVSRAASQSIPGSTAGSSPACLGGPRGAGDQAPGRNGWKHQSGLKLKSTSR